MHTLWEVLILISMVAGAKCSPIGTEQINSIKCGYGSCHPIKQGSINVHLIPHSHDDVGWVKTLDQFYYGTKSDIYKAGVVYIYDNVLKSVQKNKDRRFIYVETAFFWKWWQEQNQETKDILRKLVNSGQIEFIGGGWSMNDEAVTHYQSIIDQMSWGLKRLNDSLGECARPKMGWQIDPFGHSSEMASIFAGLGYDGVILGRIDFQDRYTRRENKSMEMVWRGSNNLGRPADIFTSVLFDHYDAPAGFCFDVLCEDEPLVDDTNSPEYNIEKKAEEFILNYVQYEKGSFQTSNVIVPMGRDFAYQEAEAWFTNMDRLIRYVNHKQEFNGTKYHLLYSTPSCYAAAVHKESQGYLTSPLKTDDFMPYASADGKYWTGFYTSRPTLKRFERMGNNFLQICKQLFSMAHLSSDFETKLNSLRESMGVMQHHDAVTGTEKEVVAYDYARLLYEGFEHCEDIASQALSKLTSTPNENFETCLLANVSQCAFSENAKEFVVTVYNPLSRAVSKYVRLPVLGTKYSVTGPDGQKLNNQIIPISKGVQNITGRTSNATLELIFQATDIPPLGFLSFYIEENDGNDVTMEEISDSFEYFNSKGIGFNINPATGFVNKLSMNGINLDVNQRFLYYNGSNGWGIDEEASGAYVFRPDPVCPLAEVSDTALFEVYRGDIVTEVHQTFSSFVKQVVRIYHNEQFIEFDWVVGPLDSQTWYQYGKEVISRFTTPLKSNKTFYTDSNGREMVKRIRNFRFTWNLTTESMESSNYYPVTSKITIKNDTDNIAFTVLTDRAQGGSSLEDGHVELMLLRATASDDELGVGESLQEMAFDEPIVARGSHFVVLGHIMNTTLAERTVASIEHDIAIQKLLDSWVFLSSPYGLNYDQYKEEHSMEFSGLQRSLPKNVHLMTLEPWRNNNFLLRLEHTFEKNEDPILSQPVIVNLNDLFTTFQINSLRETTLGGNQWLEDNQRLNFRSAHQSDGYNITSSESMNEQSNKLIISLQSMQIRTFIIGVTPNVHSKWNGSIDSIVQ